MKSFKKLRLWVLPHGRVPSTRMAQKIYKWVDPEGRPASPPADVQLLSEYPNQRHRTGGKKVLNEADESKVNILVEPGKELGISIRGGVEHGLGVYISAVEQGSAGKQYGLKVGDQILEVNGINFSSILHSEAVNVLRAQPSMVMKIKDVGKLPHSRVTTYGETQWHTTATLPAKSSQSQYQESGQSSPLFQRGAGTQMVFKKQETKQQTRGMMSDVARSILTDQEFSTFCYYINQYDHHQLSVEDLVTPLLHLLDTPEKLQILSDVRAVIRPVDLNRFSDLTVHTEIAAKQARRGAEQQAKKALGSGVGLHGEPAAYNQYLLTDGEQNVDVDAYLQADISLESEDTTLTPTHYEDESGRDIIPQRLRSAPRTNELFHAPPPPSSPPQHSTPDVSDQKAMLESRMKERRKYVLPQGSDSILDSEEGWNETSLSSIHSKSTFKAKDSSRPRNEEDEVDGPVSVSDIEAAVRKETEAKLRKEYEEKQWRIAEEERQKLLLEQQENEQRLQEEKEAMQRQFSEMKEQAKREMEEKLRAEAEERLQLEIQERERKLAEEHAKRLKEEKQRDDMERKTMQQQMQEIEERTRQELEEKIWREAAEHMKQEYEAQMQEQKEKFAREVSKKSRVDASVLEQVETRLRDQLEKKYQKQYEERMQQDMEKKRRQDEEERRRREEEEIARQNAETARLEAEEQARIELEERISQEAESKARAQYEMRLQRETEEKVRLAEEIKARQAAEQRRDQSRKEAKDLMEHQEDEKPAAVAREATVRPHEATPADVVNPQRKKELDERQKRKDLERRREENIRRREEERRQKELQNKPKLQQDAGQDDEKQQQEARRRQQEEKRRQQEEKRRQQEAERQREEQERRQREEEERSQREELRQQEEAMRQQEEEQRWEEERQREEERVQQEEKKKKEKQRRAALGVHREPVNFGTDGKGDKVRSKQKLIEEERLKAEEKLRRRIERSKDKNKKDTTVPSIQAVAPQSTGKSCAGYDNLFGEILTVTVTKVCKKLGIAIDGGASSKQKEVIIREISPGGCAAQTGTGLSVNQQILKVNGTSLKGLKHHDVVLTIKNAFEGPLNKKIELVVLDKEQ